VGLPPAEAPHGIASGKTRVIHEFHDLALIVAEDNNRAKHTMAIGEQPVVQVGFRKIRSVGLALTCFCLRFRRLRFD